MPPRPPRRCRRAYLLTHFVIDQLERRFLFTTGLEFVVLGVLLGPLVPEIRAFDDLTPIAPVIALAAGWVGLLYGMELDLARLVRTRDHAMRLGIVDAVGTGVAVGLAARLLFASGLLGDIPDDQAWLASGLLGCASASGGDSAIELLGRRYQSGPQLDLLGRSARLGDLVSIFAFGTVFCVFHTGATATSEPPNPSDWFLITVGIGIALGALFSVFLDRQGTENERFVALVGIITFASGAAFFLNLSVLLVNLVLGVVLVNTHQSGDGIRDTLAGTSRPISLLLLVFAGALWRPVPLLPAILATAGIIGVRVAGKSLACWLASLGTPLRPDLARGLLAQGDVAVAMALSFRLVYEGPAVDLAYTAVLASAVIKEFIAPRFLKGLLIDAGEVREEVRAVGGG